MNAPPSASIAVLGVVARACRVRSTDERADRRDEVLGSSSAPAGAKGDGTLKIGTLLPQTGSLAFLGPPEFAGVELAVKDINDAGGVNGKQVEITDSDSGDTSTDIASQSVDRLLSNKVDAIIGAASSSVSLSVIDKITGAGVCSSRRRTPRRAHQLRGQGPVLPHRTAGRPAGPRPRRPDPRRRQRHGRHPRAAGLLRHRSGRERHEGDRGRRRPGRGEGRLRPQGGDLLPEVGKIKAADPEAIAVIAFEETKKIIPEMVKQGIGPTTKKIYFVDGNLADYSKDFPKGTLEGVKGTLPGVVAGDEFKERLKAVNPDADRVRLRAGVLRRHHPRSPWPPWRPATTPASRSPRRWRRSAPAARSARRSRTASRCWRTARTSTTTASAVRSSSTTKGDPSEATIGIYQYGADNNYTFVEAKEGKI